MFLYNRTITCEHELHMASASSYVFPINRNLWRRRNEVSREGSCGGFVFNCDRSYDDLVYRYVANDIQSSDNATLTTLQTIYSSMNGPCFKETHLSHFFLRDQRAKVSYSIGLLRFFFKASTSLILSLSDLTVTLK
jgi:hypothetical protein